MSALLRGVERIRRIPPSVWLLLPASLCLGGFLLLSLRRCSVTALIRTIDRWRRRWGVPSGTWRDRLVTLSALSARLVKGRNSCLLRSLLAYAFLGDAQVVLGVRREGEVLRGHAWVEGPASSEEGRADYLPMARLS